MNGDRSNSNNTLIKGRPRISQCVFQLFEHGVRCTMMGLHASALRRKTVIPNVKDSAQANEQLFRSILRMLISVSLSIAANPSTSELVDGH